MGLESVADSVIGSAERKGLSGGEKKRLSIASEMLPDPSILFLDEPTSGLDSVNSLRVISCLRQLADARGEKVFVFCVLFFFSDIFYVFTFF